MKRRKEIAWIVNNIDGAQHLAQIKFGSGLEVAMLKLAYFVLTKWCEVGRGFLGTFAFEDSLILGKAFKNMNEIAEIVENRRGFDFQKDILGNMRKPSFELIQEVYARWYIAYKLNEILEALEQLELSMDEIAELELEKEIR